MVVTINNKRIIRAIFYFIASFSFTSLVQTQVIKMENYLWVIAFLLVSAVVIYYLFHKELLELTRNSTVEYLTVLISLSLVLHLATSYIVIHFFNQPTWPFDNRGASFLLMNNYYIWAKPFDILVQQLLISVFIIKLQKYGMNLKKITILMSVGFGTLHIFQILKTSLVVGLSFTVVAIGFSLIFPYLILKVRNGYAYNYVIHLAVYSFGAVLAWGLY
jgi:hypothetical protein